MPGVAQPGLPVREQADGQPHALDRLAVEPCHVGPGPVRHGQPPPRRRVLRVAFQQGQPGLADAGDDGPGTLAVPGLGGQRGEIVVGARDPGLVVAQALAGDPAGQLPCVRRRPPVPVPDRGQPEVAGGIAEPLQVVPVASEIDGAGPSR